MCDSLRIGVLRSCRDHTFLWCITCVYDAAVGRSCARQFQFPSIKSAYLVTWSEKTANTRCCWLYILLYTSPWNGRNVCMKSPAIFSFFSRLIRERSFHFPHSRWQWAEMAKKNTTSNATLHETNRLSTSYKFYFFVIFPTSNRAEEEIPFG